MKIARWAWQRDCKYVHDFNVEVTNKGSRVVHPEWSVILWCGFWLNGLNNILAYEHCIKSILIVVSKLPW